MVQIVLVVLGQKVVITTSNAFDVYHCHRDLDAVVMARKKNGAQMRAYKPPLITPPTLRFKKPYVMAIDVDTNVVLVVVSVRT